MENQNVDYNYQPSAPVDVVEPGSGKALWSMICGIAGVVLCCCGPLGVAALVLAILAKKEGNTSGKATAGLVLGIILIVLWLINLVYMFGFGGYDTYMETMSQYM